MDDMDAFERQVARELARRAGPLRPVDDGAIYRSIGAASSGTRTHAGPWTRPAARPSLAWMTLLALIALALLAVAIAGTSPPRTPDPVPGNGLIAYSLGQLPQRPYMTVHLVGPDGTGDRSVGPGLGSAFSADGRVFTYIAGSWPDQVVMVGAADGSAMRSIGIEPTLPTAISPDGSLIAWFKRIRPITFSGPDGSGGGIGASSELWVSPTDGGPGRRLVPTPDDPLISYESPVWSPDGRSIAFAAMRAVIAGGDAWSYRDAIHVVRADGTDLRVLTDHPGSDSAWLAWSPDSRHLAYTALPGETTAHPALGGDEYQRFQGDDVFVIATDGTGERNLTQSQQGEYQPRWSPDGTAIAWLGSETGDQLVVQPMDGTSPIGAAIQGPRIGSDDFVWSPDGTRIAFGMDGSLVSIAADLATAPEAILTVDAPIDPAGMGFAWQRLDPDG
jgi:hypothetical protein